MAEPPPISENSICHLSRIERDKEGLESGHRWIGKGKHQLSPDKGAAEVSEGNTTCK